MKVRTQAGQDRRGRFHVETQRYGIPVGIGVLALALMPLSLLTEPQEGAMRRPEIRKTDCRHSSLRLDFPCEGPYPALRKQRRKEDRYADLPPFG